MDEKIVGYRLVEKHEIIKPGDVAGSSMKKPIDTNIWNNTEAHCFNQPVYRPMSAFTDFYKESV